MNRPTIGATLGAFVGTAWVRMINRSNALDRMFKPKAVPDARTGTKRRGDGSSKAARWLSYFLAVSMIGGMIMFSITGMQTMIDVAHSRSIPADRPIPVLGDEYEAFRAAMDRPEAEREAALGEAVRSSFDSVARWLGDDTQAMVGERIKQHGLAALVPVDPADGFRGKLAVMTAEARREALAGIGVYWGLIVLATGLMAVGMMNKNLSQADPNLAWLFHFPISRRALFFARLVEYVCDNIGGLIAFSAACFVAGVCGFSFAGGLAFALGATISLMLTVAAYRLTLEIGLLQCCSRKARGWICGSASAVGGIGLFYAMLSVNTGPAFRLMPAAARHLPEWFFWNPTALGLGTNASAAGTGAWWMVGPVVAAAAAAFAVLAAVRLTAGGLATGVDSARGPATGVDTSGAGALRIAEAHRPTREPFFTGMIGKELLQIRRQPEHAAQVITAPLLLAVLMWLNGSNNPLAFAARNIESIATSIFVGSAYLLLVAASQMLRAELKTVWFLQCRPQSLAASIEAKAHAWGGIAIGVTLITLAGVIVWQPAEAGAVLRRTPFMLAALWLTAESMFGLLSLGATIVSEQTVKFRKSALILPGLLTAAAATAIHSGDYWDQFVLLVVMGVLNTAIRQKQDFELRWLGEPSETPPVRLYALHGLTTILAFLFVRDTLKPLLAAGGWTDAEILVGAYTTAAAVVGLASWWWVRRRGLQGSKVESGDSVLRPMAIGLAATCLAGFAWDSLIRATVGYAAGAIGPSWHADGTGSARGGLLLIFLVVLVAPIFEEWIFRGLLYRSLRQSSGAAVSIAAASLLFAVIHPLSSCVPILVLAVATAWVYERTGRLGPAIGVHTGYNLFIVLLWNLRG